MSKEIPMYFAIICILAVMIAGCSNSTSTSVPTPTPQIVYVTVTPTQAPSAIISNQETSVPLTPIVTATPSVKKAYTTDEINKHFVDIAFSNDFTVISKWTAGTMKISITGAFNNNDKMILSTFQQQFNDHSSTTKLPSDPTESTQGSILINFLSGSSLKNLAQDTSYTSSNTKQIINKDDAGTIGSIYRVNRQQSYSTGVVYINSDLTGDERAHYIIRGLLYYLGFPGETGTYPDSIFYSGQNNATTPNLVDWKAIELMYGAKITNGMTLSNVKSVLLIMNTN
jgi:hypothetical protein